MRFKDFKIQDTLLYIFAIIFERVMLSQSINDFQMLYESGLMNDNDIYMNNDLAYKLLIAGTVSITASYIILIFTNFIQFKWKKQLLGFIKIALLTGTILKLIGTVKRTIIDTKDENVKLNLWIYHSIIFFKGMQHACLQLQNYENYNSTDQVPQNISTSDQI